MNAPTKNLPAERKPQVVAGAPIAALVPQSLDEAFRLSSALAASGLAPRGMDRPEQVMVAILAGAELGLPPYQAMQSFAVVNGRATIWGDAIPALLWSHGFKLEEWADNDEEPTKAFCKVTRPDGTEIERSFSVAQAKKAGLWGKAGPWQSYPGRMLQMRARALAARDGATDVLRGVQVREEVEDYTHVRDVTPKPSGLRERLAGPSGEGFTANHVPAEPVDFAEHAAEVAEAEVVDQPAPEEPQAHADEAPAVEPATPAEEPVATLEVADADFDPLDWAASFSRGLSHLNTVGDVASAWSKAKAAGYVFKLQAKSREMAEQLATAVNDRVAEIKAGNA